MPEERWQGDVLGGKRALRSRTSSRLYSLAAALLVLAISASLAYGAFGSLNFVEVDKDGDGGVVDGLNGARSAVVSPDGAHIYVIGENEDAIATFSRNAMTGALSFVEVDKDGDGGVVDGLDQPRGAAISPDGAHVYVAAFMDDSIATFSRNAMTGALSFVEVDKDGDGGVVDGLGEATAAAASPDGAHVYVSSLGDDAIATFSRNAMTGALNFVEVDKDGDGGVVDGLNGAVDASVSPNGAHVYVAADTDNSIATFSREGMSTGGGGAGAAATPSNVFTIGRLRGKTLTLNVSSAGRAEVTDAGAQPASSRAVAAAKGLLNTSGASGGPGTIAVALNLTKAAKQRLRRKGKVKLNTRITFTPNGGTASSQTTKLKVRRKRPPV